MTEILLTHSYFLRFDPKEYRAMMPYPPLGTITAASMLRSAGFGVALHDVMLADSEDEILGALEKHQPRLLIIYDDSFNYLTKMCLSRMREAAFRMAAHARHMGCTVAVFSSDAADHLTEYFNHNVDFVVCGEAEVTLVELAHSLLRDGTPAARNISGLAFSDHGSVTKTQKRPILKNLDSLPIAAWDLVDLDLYRRVWHRGHGYFSLNISTTRGCPFHCNWCAKPLYGQVYNSRSPRSVVDEMKFLREIAGPDHLWITDDIFGLKPGWIAEFARLVRAENAVIPFKCLSRADLLLNDDTVRNLALAGCKSVWIGAESGSQKVLDAMEKGTTIGEIRTATELLHDSGISVGFFLQFGYPGEGWDEIRQTFELVRTCGPDEIGVSVSYPLPGTSFYERVKAELGVKQNWVDSQDLDVLFSGRYSRTFYRTLHKLLHKRFSIWKNMRQLRRTLRHPKKVRFSTLRSLAAVLFHAITLPLFERRLDHERDQTEASPLEPSPSRA
ncbi:MAG TPA: radical SAM protein [Bacteroidota bacterium]|nr:radical SAM protein [Bacteroidota bacterium]